MIDKSQDERNSGLLVGDPGTEIRKWCPGRCCMNGSGAAYLVQQYPALSRDDRPTHWRLGMEVGGQQVPDFVTNARGCALLVERVTSAAHRQLHNTLAVLLITAHVNVGGGEGARIFEQLRDAVCLHDSLSSVPGALPPKLAAKPLYLYGGGRLIGLGRESCGMPVAGAGHPLRDRQAEHVLEFQKSAPWAFFRGPTWVSTCQRVPRC